MLKKQIIFFVFLLGIGIISINWVFAQIDIVDELEFIKTGEIHTKDQKFEISNELEIRGFFEGKIIRISGITSDAYPYVIYSKIKNNEILTNGKIFKEGKFTDLVFKDNKMSDTVIVKKLNDLLILAKIPQRLYSGDVAKIDIKVYDKKQNILKDFDLNYGYVQYAMTQITIKDQQNTVIQDFKGKTDQYGYFHAEFLIENNSPPKTLQILVVAEDENSLSSDTFEIFVLGQRPRYDNTP